MNEELYIFNLITIGVVEMISATEAGKTFYAANNTQAVVHPFWSIIGAYLDDFAPEDLICADEDDSLSCVVTPTCDLTLNYDTLEALQAASGSWPNICKNQYVLGTLNAMLDTAMNNYTAADAGYDDVWGDYVESVKEMVPSALNEFMAHPSNDKPGGGPGNKYFACSYAEGSRDPKTYPCPVPLDVTQGVGVYEITYTLTDADGFWAELKKTYGIPQSWVTFGSSRNNPDCGSGISGGHILDKRAGNCPERIDQQWIGIPVSSGDITVANPKDVITNALPTIDDLHTTILSRQMDLALGQWAGPSDDILQVVSMPVFTLIQAVAQMADAKARGQAEKANKEKAEKNKLIMEILGIVFAFIPFLDEFTPELVALDGVFEIIAAAGNTGLAIKQIIDDPTSAPFELLGALTGGVFKDRGDMASLAKTRRGISADDLTAIGTSFKKMDDDFQGLIKHNCKL